MFCLDLCFESHENIDEQCRNGIRLVRADVVVGAALGDSLADDAKVVPFRAGRTLAWKMEEL